MLVWAYTVLNRKLGIWLGLLVSFWVSLDGFADGETTSKKMTWWKM